MVGMYVACILYVREKILRGEKQSTLYLEITKEVLYINMHYLHRHTYVDTIVRYLYTINNYNSILSDII